MNLKIKKTVQILMILSTMNVFAGAGTEETGSSYLSKSCPFYTTVSNDEKAMLTSLQEFFKVLASEKAECQAATALGLDGTTNLQNIIASGEAICKARELEILNLKKQALSELEGLGDISLGSIYQDCKISKLSVIAKKPQNRDAAQKCIEDKYNELVNAQVKNCKTQVDEVKLSDKLTDGASKVGDALLKTATGESPCSADAKTTMKKVIGNVAQIKDFLALAGPYGMAASLGLDFLDKTTDKIIQEKASAAQIMVDDLMAQEDYEKMACLYYGVQQKIYCNEKNSSIPVTEVVCAKNSSHLDLIKLLENVQDIKKASDLTVGVNQFVEENNLSDTSYLEIKMSDLTKYARAAEPLLRERISALPKISRPLELEKIERFYNWLNMYENSNPGVDDREYGPVALREIMNLLFSNSPAERINFEQILMNATPKLTIDAIKKAGLASALKDLQKSYEDSGNVASKFQRYKNTIQTLAKSKLGDQLNRLNDDLKKQDLTKSNSLTEGTIRNLVRHCSLMQEMYDNNIEGKIPDGCIKINCNAENRLKFYLPKEGENAVLLYRKEYCEKTAKLKDLEDQYVNEYRDSKGPFLCGKKLKDYIGL